MNKNIKRALKLAEESGEITQATMKALIHGFDERNPRLPESPNNREALEDEIGDLIAVIDLMIEGKQLDGGRIFERRMKKRKTLEELGYRGEEILK